MNRRSLLQAAFAGATLALAARFDPWEIAEPAIPPGGLDFDTVAVYRATGMGTYELIAEIPACEWGGAMGGHPDGDRYQTVVWTTASYHAQRVLQ